MLLGATGKMGRAICTVFRDTYEICGYSSATLDVRNFGNVFKEIEHIKPDVIINTVGSVGIEASEKNYTSSYELNCALPYFLAQKAQALGIPLIHFSSNAVFDGFSDRVYFESDIPAPINIYGITKFAGEKAVQGQCAKHIIVRTSTLLGESNQKKQMFDRLLSLAANGAKEILLSDDLYGCPTYTIDVALRLKELLGRDIFGIHHICNEGSASVYDFVSHLFRELQVMVPLRKVSYKYFSPKTQIPQHLNISTEKYPPMRNWKSALTDYACQINNV